MTTFLTTPISQLWSKQKCPLPEHQDYSSLSSFFYYLPVLLYFPDFPFSFFFHLSQEQDFKAHIVITISFNLIWKFTFHWKVCKIWVSFLHYLCISLLLPFYFILFGSIKANMSFHLLRKKNIERNVRTFGYHKNVLVFHILFEYCCFWKMYVNSCY